MFCKLQIWSTWSSPQDTHPPIFCLQCAWQVIPLTSTLPDHKEFGVRLGRFFFLPVGIFFGNKGERKCFEVNLVLKKVARIMQELLFSMKCEEAQILFISCQDSSTMTWKKSLKRVFYFIYPLGFSTSPFPFLFPSHFYSCCYWLISFSCLPHIPFLQLHFRLHLNFSASFWFQLTSNYFLLLVYQGSKLYAKRK